MRGLNKPEKGKLMLNFINIYEQDFWERLSNDLKELASFSSKYRRC